MFILVFFFFCFLPSLRVCQLPNCNLSLVWCVSSDAEFTDAISNAVPGTKIFLQGQTPFEYNIASIRITETNSGNELNPVVVAPYPGHTVTIYHDCDDLDSYGTMIHFDSANHWKIHGNVANGGELEIKGCGISSMRNENIFKIESANGIIIEDLSLTVEYSENHAVVLLTGTDNDKIIIRNVEFKTEATNVYRTMIGIGIMNDTESVLPNAAHERVLIQGCKFEIEKSAIFLYGAHYVTIDSNYFLPKRENVMLLDVQLFTSNIIVQNNIFDEVFYGKFSKFHHNSNAIGYSQSLIMYQNNYFNCFSNSLSSLEVFHFEITGGNDYDNICIINNIFNGSCSSNTQGLVNFLGSSCDTNCIFESNLLNENYPVEMGNSQLLPPIIENIKIQNGPLLYQHAFLARSQSGTFQGIEILKRPLPFFQPLEIYMGKVKTISPQILPPFHDFIGDERNLQNDNIVIGPFQNVIVSCGMNEDILSLCEECIEGFVPLIGNCVPVITVVGISIGASAFLLCICIIIILFICIISIIVGVFIVKKTKKIKREGESISKTGKEKELSMLDIDKLESKESAKFKINEALFTIKFEEVKMVKKIGKGGFATVYQGVWNNIDIAFKSIDTRLLGDSQDDFNQFEKELQLFSSLRHPNIPNFYGASLNPPRCGIVMEFCEFGDLKSFLQDRKSSIDLEKRIDMMKQIANGMMYLHKKNVIHRDLKPENILITKSFVPKICDFGISKLVEKEDETKTRNVGTSLYMAPEVALGTKYDEKCDVYPFGLILWSVLSLDFHPYGKTANSFNIQVKVASDPTYKPNIMKISEEIRTNYEWLIDVMKNSWDSDPSVRKSYEEIYEIFEKNKK